MINPNDSDSMFQQLSRNELKNLMHTCVDNKLGSTTYKQKRRSYKKNLVIEISGMPRSFKSTLILSSIVNLRTKKITSNDIRERPVNIDKRLSPLQYTISISNTAMHRLWENTNRHTVTFIDRGVYDRLAFLYAYYKLKVIKKSDFDLVAKMLINIYGDETDGLIICNSKPESSLQREGERDKPGTIINKEFLTLLDEAYKNLPQMILNIRKDTKFKDKPLFLSQLNSDDNWNIYSDSFLKSVGSIYNLFNLSSAN